MVSDVTSVAKLEELVRFINFMGNQFDDFSKKIDFVLKEIKDLKSENQKIITENKYLKEEIIPMKQKIDDLE
jgi:regulator of replication initiation timing